MKRRAYASFSLESRSMLAVWLDDEPSGKKDQRDPDGWTTGAAQSDYLAKRLAELANAPDVSLHWLIGDAAAMWSRIEQGRRRNASKAARKAVVDQVLAFDFPADLEEAGRREGAERLAGRGRKVAR